MSAIAPQWLFLILGPLFLVLGIARWFGAGMLISQARTWLILGATFTAVAAWLWTMPTG